MQAPEEIPGQLVVVHRVALAEETEKVLIYEVKPEESVSVAVQIT